MDLVRIAITLQLIGTFIVGLEYIVPTVWISKINRFLNLVLRMKGAELAPAAFLLMWSLIPAIIVNLFRDTFMPSDTPLLWLLLFYILMYFGFYSAKELYDLLYWPDQTSLSIWEKARKIFGRTARVIVPLLISLIIALLFGLLASVLTLIIQTDTQFTSIQWVMLVAPGPLILPLIKMSEYLNEIIHKLPKGITGFIGISFLLSGIVLLLVSL